MFRKVKYSISALLLLAATTFAQYSVTKQLGVSGVTAAGGPSFTNMLVKTDGDGLIDSSLLPDLSGSALSGWMYVDYHNSDSTNVVGGIHGSMLKPYKTLEFALDRADELDSIPSKIFIVSLSDAELVTSFSLHDINTLTLSGAGIAIHGLSTLRTDLDLTLDNVIVNRFSAPTTASAGSVATVYLRHGGAIRYISSTEDHLNIYSDGEIPKYDTNEEVYPHVQCRSLVSSDSLDYTADTSAWGWADLPDGNMTVSNALDTLAEMIPTPDDINKPALLFAWNHQSHKWYWSDILDSYMPSNTTVNYIQNQGFLTSVSLNAYKPWSWIEDYLGTNFLRADSLDNKYYTRSDANALVATINSTYEKKSDLVNDILADQDIKDAIVFEDEIDSKIDSRIDVTPAIGAVATNSAINAISNTITSSSSSPPDYQNLHSELVGLIDERIEQQAGWASKIGGTYTLVTNVSELAAGNYVIVESDLAEAMNNTLSDTYLGLTDITLKKREGNTLVINADTDADIVWALATSGANWTIKNVAYDSGTGGFVTHVGVKNVSMPPTAESASAWSISETETGGVFVFQNASAITYSLQYNASSHRFTTYATNQRNLSLYKQSTAQDTTFLYSSDLRQYPLDAGYEYTSRDLLGAKTISEHFESTNNKVTSIRTILLASDDKYPSEKAVADAIVEVSNNVSSALSLRIDAIDAWIGSYETTYLPATYVDESYRITPDVYFESLTASNLTLVGRFYTANYSLSTSLALDSDIDLDGNAFYAGLGMHALPDDGGYAVFLSSGNTGKLELYGNTSVYGGLTSTGGGSFDGDVDITGDLAVDGFLANGNASIEGNLTVDRDAEIWGTATIAELRVDDEATIESSLFANGDVFAGSDLSVQNNLIVSNSASIAENMSIGENVSVGGSANVGSRASGTIGENSFAQGSSVLASGNSSYSGGHNTTSAGCYSYAGGLGSSSTGDVSVASGINSQATHNYSFVWNGEYAAEGVSSTAVSTEPVGVGFRFVPSDFGYPSSLTFSSLLGNNNIAKACWTNFRIKVHSKCPALEPYRRSTTGEFILTPWWSGSRLYWDAGPVNGEYIDVSSIAVPIEVFDSQFELLPKLNDESATTTPIINVGTLKSYVSHEAGTFNVNPVNGDAGFYIGDKTIRSIIGTAISRTSKNVRDLESNYYEIDTSDGNIHWLYNTINAEDKVIVLPISEVNELETLTVYITQRWDRSPGPEDDTWWSMYDFSDENFLNYPANKPWLDGADGGPNAVFKCEFESLIGCYGWYMIDCTKFILPDDYEYEY